MLRNTCLRTRRQRSRRTLSRVRRCRVSTVRTGAGREASQPANISRLALTSTFVSGGRSSRQFRASSRLPLTHTGRTSASRSAKTWARVVGACDQLDEGVGVRICARLCDVDAGDSTTRRSSEMMSLLRAARWGIGRPGDMESAFAIQFKFSRGISIAVTPVEVTGPFPRCAGVWALLRF